MNSLNIVLFVNAIIHFRAYINDPASYARKWIMAFTNKTIFKEFIGDQTQYCKLAGYRLSTICTQLEKSILNSTKECEGKEDVGVCYWIDTFLADMSSSAVLPSHSLVEFNMLFSNTNSNRS